jgi:hypothetical protein
MPVVDLVRELMTFLRRQPSPPASGTVAGNLPADTNRPIAKGSWRSRLVEAEQRLAGDEDARLCDVFGAWPVTEFGRLFLEDLSGQPAIAGRLPRTPSPEIQRTYTGREGTELMRYTIDAVMGLRRLYELWGGGICATPPYSTTAQAGADSHE